VAIPTIKATETTIDAPMFLEEELVGLFVGAAAVGATVVGEGVVGTGAFVGAAGLFGALVSLPEDYFM